MTGLCVSAFSQNNHHYWQGEVTGVYKDKARLKVYISSPELLRLPADEVYKKLNIYSQFDLFQKYSIKKAGSFHPESVRIDKQDGKRIQVELFGYYTMDPGFNIRDLTLDFFISPYAVEEEPETPVDYGRRAGEMPDMIRHPVDKKEMVLVRRGLFLIGQGSVPEKDNFNPHYNNPDSNNMIDIPSYYIDKYEVTNHEYWLFLKKTNNPPPPYWNNSRYNEGEADHPVINLTYREVEKYAQWAGKKIPTEMEWEKAARGPGLNITTNRDETLNFEIQTFDYPFGNEFDAQLCNSRESGLGKTVSVYELSFKGASPYGAVGMCGNAAEWTSSWYEAYPGNKTGNILYGKQYKVIRGGSFLSDKNEASGIYRFYAGIPSLEEDRRGGFRLVIMAK